MTTGRRNDDLGHIFSGDELHWLAECKADCGWTYDGYGQRKGVVIREARRHQAETHHRRIELWTVVYQFLTDRSGEHA